MTLIQETLDRYYDAVFDTNRTEALQVIDAALKQGVTPEEVVFDVVIPAIDRMILDLTVNLDSTISQHFIASRLAEEVTEAMILRFKQAPGTGGHVVIGTAWSDFHGLGKKIVSGCLRAHMFTVQDLGLNVSPESFVEVAVAEKAQVIGISSMMLHTAKGERGAVAVRRLLKEQELEDKIKLIVGGAPYRFDPDLYNAVGADGWAENGVTATKVIGEMIKEVRYA